MSRMIDYICLIENTQEFLETLSKNEDLVNKHWAFLQKLKKDNLLTLSGVSLDGYYEIYIMKSNNKNDAESIIKDDPLVLSGLLKYSIHPIRSTLVTDSQIEQALENTIVKLDSIYSFENTNQYFGTITGRSTFINDFTKEEEQIMMNHFQYLKNRFDNEKLVFAGPILEEGKFGVTVFIADDYDEALYFVNNDPSVKGKIMKPGLHPFRILLKR